MGILAILLFLLNGAILFLLQYYLFKITCFINYVKYFWPIKVLKVYQVIMTTF